MPAGRRASQAHTLRRAGRLLRHCIIAALQAACSSKGPAGAPGQGRRSSLQRNQGDDLQHWSGSALTERGRPTGSACMSWRRHTPAGCRDLPALCPSCTGRLSASSQCSSAAAQPAPDLWPTAADQIWAPAARSEWPAAAPLAGQPGQMSLELRSRVGGMCPPGRVLDWLATGASRPSCSPDSSACTFEGLRSASYARRCKFCQPGPAAATPHPSSRHPQKVGTALQAGHKADFDPTLIGC